MHSCARCSPMTYLHNVFAAKIAKKTLTYQKLLHKNFLSTHSPGTQTACYETH